MDKVSFPEINRNIINKIVKSSKAKNSNFIIENVKMEYVAFNDSVFLSKTNEVMKNGDLDVDDIHSTNIGRHIIRNGDRPQRITRAYDPMSQFYNLNKQLFDDCNVNVDKNVTMSGCFKSNKITLQRTMIPEEDSEIAGLPSMKKIKKFKSAIKSAIRKLKIPQLGKCEKDDMLLTSFNGKTFPGFSYKEYYNLNTKEEASEVALKVANKRWENITKCFKNGKKLKRNKLFPNTFVVGARNKRDYDFEDEDILSSRAVHMPEFHTELNSIVWIEQIANEIKRKQSGPLYIGNSFVKYDRVLKDSQNCKNIIEGDWKRFDSRLYLTNIIIGLSILRLYYDITDKEIDYHFIAIFDTIGIKDYYTPGGYLYRMIHGLPSGVCSTTLLGSVINLVNLLYCTQDYNSKRINFIVGGDDFLVCVKDQIFKKEILECMIERSKEIGQVFKFLEYKSFDNKNILEKPSFFKYTIDRNEPVVFPSALLERTFLPWNKKYDSNFKIFTFLQDLIPSLGSPRSFHIPFYAFYISIAEKVMRRKVHISEIFNLHKDIYVKVMSGKRYYKKDTIIYFKNFSPNIKALLASSKGIIKHYTLFPNRKITKLRVKFN